MKHSALQVRIITVVIATVILTALLTTFFFGMVSSTTFSRIKEQELRPRASAVATLVSRYGNRLDDEILQSLIDIKRDDESLIGVYGMVIDAGGNVLVKSDILADELLIGFNTVVQRTLAGEALNTSDFEWFPSQDIVFVSQPIYRGEELIGAVFLFVPLFEAMAALSSLIGALAMSLLIGIPFIFLVTYYLMANIVNPLRKMRDAAMAMAAGNFKVRASDEWRGEVGQLGQSLNYMAVELERTISEVELEKKRLMHMIDGIGEGIVGVDMRGRVTHQNPALREMMGNISDENGMLTHEEIREDFDTVISSREERTRQFTVADKLIRMTVTPLHDDKGVLAGAVALFSDITQAERLERTRRDYVANVSHEFRSPLTAVRGLIEPLRDGLVRDEETQRRYYDIILREIMRLSRLINDLMELSRLQSGSISVQKESVDMRELLGDVCERYAQAAQEQGRLFGCADSVWNCPVCNTNPDRIEQVLVILLDNAIKYSGEGCQVGLDAEWDEEKVTVTVKDNGPGISEADLPYVFERFYKADKAHSSPGSGLGLSIARELLRWMGEDIWVKSRPGEGTEFSFTIRREGR